MPPVHSVKNQYQGINAHLHSLLQTDGGWDSFHTIHISHLTMALQTQLLPLGYEADIQQSLQIRRIGAPPRYPKSDVTIYDRDPARLLKPTTSVVGGSREIVMPIPALLDFTDEESEYYKAVAVFRSAPNRSQRGEPVVWIELLSPSNKPTGQDFGSYKDKRNDILHSGLVFIEMDYLHQSPGTFDGLSSYQPRIKGQERDADAQPYRIAIIDPRPDIVDGQSRTTQFDVDDTIPSLTIPLNAKDKIEFNFVDPYNMTFEGMVYGNKVDYSQLPVNFDLYSPADQTRIVNRMIAVIEAFSSDDRLDSPPLPVPQLTLSEGMEKLQSLL